MDPHAERRRQIIEIERRSWRLWIISLTITGGLTFGFTLLLYPMLGGYAEYLQGGSRVPPQLLLGLVVMVVLSAVFVVLKQRELNSLRNYIIATMSRSAHPAERYLHDPLTGALDRSALPELLKDQSTQADRASAPFCLAIFDINDFGRINEREGNLVGDLVLKEFSLLLQRTVRATDQVLRYGPDEFLCTLTGSALAGAEAFVQRVEKGWLRVPRLRALTYARGMSEYRSGLNPEDVLGVAETELANSIAGTTARTAPPPSP